METIKNNNKMDDKEPSIADLLCSTGYLPPRNGRDIERFERIYRGRKFKTEVYTINANDIFDKVICEENAKTRRVRQRVSQSLLRAASGIKYNGENCITEILCQDIDKKK